MDLSVLTNNFEKAKRELQQIEENKINGLDLDEYIFNRFEAYVDPVYFIENILRAHLPPSRRHLHSNQVELIRAACNPRIRKIAAMFARQCFAKSTQLIDANNNLINVENIQIGTKLKTPDNKSATVIQTTSGIAQLYKISDIENFDIPYIVTDNHQLVLTDGKKQIIQTVKDCLQNNFNSDNKSNSYGLKCITYSINCNAVTYNDNSYETHNNIYSETYLNEILNSSLEAKYKFIQQFLNKCTWNSTQRFTYYIENNININLLRRILWSMGFSSKLINNNILCIKYQLQYQFKIEPYKIDQYYGFTLDHNSLCVLADNTVTHNSGKCFAKDTLIRMFDGSIKKVQDIKENDKIMGSDSKIRTVDTIISGTEQMITIKSLDDEYNPFTVNLSHDLVVYDGNNRFYISVDQYIKKNLNLKMKRAQIEYNDLYSYVNAYYAGYDHIFSYLLNYHSSVRKYIFAGYIDSIEYQLIENGIVVEYRNKLLELSRSLGFIAYKKNNSLYIKGNFSDIPFKTHKELNDIYYNNQYFNFTLLPSNENIYYGFSLKDDNKEFLLADNTIVKNTESLSCLVSYLICIYPQMRIGVFTPRIQQAEVSIGRASIFFQMNEDKIPHKITKLTKHKIELSNGSYVQAVSGSDQANIEGLTFDTIILDEAQKIKLYIFVF